VLLTGDDPYLVIQKLRLCIAAIYLVHPECNMEVLPAQVVDHGHHSLCRTRVALANRGTPRAGL
jgi:hypothetical protein